MFDFILSLNELFGTTVLSYKEILREFNCEYKIRKNNLPDYKSLCEFIEKKPRRDEINIDFISDNGSVCVRENGEWKGQYISFVHNVYEDTDIDVDIKVSKQIEEGIMSVYNLKDFSRFLSGLIFQDIFYNFTTLFQECGEHIEFRLLDINGSLVTSSIAFSDNDVRWTNNHYSRVELLRKCQDASIFLEREKIRLIPQDFQIYNYEGEELECIANMFGKLKTILSFVYMANTSSIINEKVILQFNPTTWGYEYQLEQLAGNTVVPQIFDWVFSGESYVDKASIARKIINTYYKDKESIPTMDEAVLYSIKSDYVIYQKNHVDQYIEMKNKISDYIVLSMQKILDLSQDITDAFRNNLVAVIVFLMTVLFTDCIDFSKFISGDYSPKLVAVCALFTVVTGIYFCATSITVKHKWSWLRTSYQDLKNNYLGLFEPNDIDEAFGHDESIKHAEQQYKFVRNKYMWLWIILTLTLAVFTVILFIQEKGMYLF